MDELRTVGLLMRFGGLALLVIITLSPLHVRKIAWFMLGVYGLVLTHITAVTVDFTALDGALGIVGYLSAPVMTCLSFAMAVWRANE